MNIRIKTFLALSLFFCASCAQKAETEAISINPDTINAEYRLASYPIDVTSNCPWSVKIQDSDAAWVSIPTKGSGGEKINVRILKNPYKDARSATLEFITGTGVSASLKINQAGDPNAEEKVEMNVRLGTYNLRMEQADEAAENKWAVRKDRLLVSIRENAFGIFGVQEVNTTMQSWLKTNFGSEYEIFFFSPYSQSGTGDKAQGILFKAKEFDLISKGFFWASNTPDIMTKNDTGDQGNFSRGGNWVILKHKETGIELFFMNTHGCLNSQPNKDNAIYYKQIEQKYNTRSLPSFFVGDMNARPTYDAIATFKLHWKDSYDVVASDKKSGPENTYNGFTATQGKYRLDYVFCRGDKYKVNAYCVNNKLYNGQFASDHFPVYADVTINK